MRYMKIRRQAGRQESNIFERLVMKKKIKIKIFRGFFKYFGLFHVLFGTKSFFYLVCVPHQNLGVPLSFLRFLTRLGGEKWQKKTM